MHRRTHRGHHLGLTLIGVLLTFSGGAMIANHLGGFGTRAATEHLYPQPATDWIAAHRWAYWIAAVVALILAGLALRWLLVQLRTDRLHRLSMDTDRDPDPHAGITTLTASAVLDAISTDIDRIPGVHKATAALSGTRDAPELWLTVTLHDNADSGTVRTQLVDTVLSDARTSLEKPDMPAYLTLKVSTRRAARQIH